MKWLELLRRGKSDSSADLLRDLVLDAAKKGDKETLDRMCRDERDRILANFRMWQKVPKELRADPDAVARYVRGMIVVADWFARNGSPHLREALRGAGAGNPITHWQDRFGESDRLKANGHFAEAIVILEEIAKEMTSGRDSSPAPRRVSAVRCDSGRDWYRSIRRCESGS
jgi:hypothetical protein